MANFYAAKVVTSLPTTLSPNCLYVVRVGVGVKFYVTDSAGAVAHGLATPMSLAFSAKWSLSNGGAWRGPNHVSGGFFNTTWSRTYGGTGAAPTNAQGRYNAGLRFRAGDHLRDIRLEFDRNNAEVTSADFYAAFLTLAAGVASVAQSWSWSVAIPDSTVQSVVQALDYVAPSDGVLVLASRTTSALTATRFLRCTGDILFERLA